MEKEVWKYLKGSNKLYKISNFGNFKTCIGKEKPLNVYYTYDGYGHVHLSLKKYNQSLPLVHILVFENFGNEKRKRGYVIIHKDNVRKNNDRNNLKQIKRGEHMKDIWNNMRKEEQINIKNEKDYFSTLEVARLYACTVQWIVQLIWMKKLIAIRGKQYRWKIYKCEVNRFLKKIKQRNNYERRLI